MLPATTTNHFTDDDRQNKDLLTVKDGSSRGKKSGFARKSILQSSNATAPGSIIPAANNSYSRIDNKHATEANDDDDEPLSKRALEAESTIR